MEADTFFGIQVGRKRAGRLLATSATRGRILVLEGNGESCPDTKGREEGDVWVVLEVCVQPLGGLGEKCRLLDS